MDGRSGYTFLIRDSNQYGPCIEVHRRVRGRSPILPIEVDGVINSELIELYELWVSGEDGDGTNEHFGKIGLVDENGDYTSGGKALIDYMLMTSDSQLGGLQAALQEIDDKYRRTPTDGSGLDTNHISGVEEDHFRYILTGCEKRTLEALSELERKMRLYYIRILASEITDVNPASESAVLQVTGALEKLVHEKYVKAEKQRIYIKGHKSLGIVYTTTKLGKEYLKYVAGQIEAGEDVQQIEDTHGPTEEEEPQTEYISVDDSCDTLYSLVLGEFREQDENDTLLKLNIDGTECPVLYTSLDKREGYPGAVYVRIGDENAYCAGYVNESDKLIISPEGMYALLVKGNVDNIRNLSTRKFIEVFDGLTGTFRDMMGNEMSSIALQLEASTYLNGNVKKLVSGKRNLKPDGQLFVAALRELFETDSLPVVDTKGDEHTISPYNISKYMPKNTDESVEPENDSPESPENSQGGKMTLADKQQWLEEQGL